MDFGNSGECASFVESHGTSMITESELSYLVVTRERLFVMSLHASRLFARRYAREVESCAVSMAAICGIAGRLPLTLAYLKLCSILNGTCMKPACASPSRP